MLQCQRGLILKKKLLAEHCKVKVSRSKVESIINQIDINTYVLTTWGEKLVTRCPGQNEVEEQLAPGTYNHVHQNAPLQVIIALVN